MPSSARGSARRFVVGLAVLLAALVPLRAQEADRASVPASRPTSAPAPQQDEIEALRNDPREWFDIKEAAKKIWEEKKNKRDAMIALLSDPGLSPKVFTGLAYHFAEARERAVIPTVLDALATREVGALRETLERHVMGNFHRSASVLPEVRKALVALSARPGEPAAPGFAKLARLYPVLVEATPQNGNLVQDAARYQAIADILEIWGSGANAVDPGVAAALREQLAALAGGIVDLETRAGWLDWFARFRADNELDRSLSVQRIARDAVEGLRSRIDQLTAQRRKEVGDLIMRMKGMGEPPTAYLMDPDAAVRRIALRALRGMSDDLVVERRTPAIQEITQALEGADLDDDRRKTLLEAAGALGRKLPEEERPALAAAIFKGPDGLGPEVWRARLEAVATIGAIDDAGRLERLYDLANDEARRALPAWVAVRADVIRACQTLRLDLPLVGRGLEDLDEEVRGTAASTLVVAKTSWNVELVSRLVRAAVAEEGTTALTRMLEALRNIARERADLVRGEALEALVALEGRVNEANDARLLAIVLHVVLDEKGAGALAPESVENLLRVVFGGGASPVDRSRLVEQLLTSDRALAARLLSLLLIETPTALDHERTDRAVARILEREDDAIPAASLLEIAARISGRADMPTAHRSSAAARLGGAALARMRAGEAHEGVDLEELDRRVEAWRLASGQPDLVAEARAELDARVAAQPEDPNPLLRRAAFLEGLQVVNDTEGTELLAIAEKDLEAALEKAGAMSEPEVQAIRLRLARVLLLQGDFGRSKALLETVGGDGPALLLRQVQAVLEEPGAPALAILATVGEEQLRRSPETYALLRVAARALSSRVEDRLAVSDALAGASGVFERELDGECRVLQELDVLVGAALAGTLDEAGRARLDAQPRLASALAARRALLLPEGVLASGGQTLLARIREWSPAEAGALLVPPDPDEQTLTRTRSALERLTVLEVELQKRRARFLKLLARSLYSP